VDSLSAGRFDEKLLSNHSIRGRCVVIAATRPTRLAAIEGVSFSKYVKGKIDCDAAGIDIILLQTQVARLEQEIKELKTGVVTRSLGIAKEEDFIDRPEIDKWFDD
jgi:hypothetical protein